MLRISELDWPRVLLTRGAAVLLGIAAALSLSAVVIIHPDLNLNALSPLRPEVLSLIAAASALGFILLLICMGFFWLKCDSSPRYWKTIWFLILLIGFPYGGAALYYVVVYLPAVIRRKPGEHVEDHVDHLSQASRSRERFGPFRKSLLIGWAFLLLPVFAALTIPKTPEFFSGVVAAVFFAWSVIVVLEAVIYFLLSLFRSGMNRRETSDRRGTHGSKNKD